MILDVEDTKNMNYKKIDKLNFIKIKHLCSLKNTVIESFSRVEVN